MSVLVTIYFFYVSMAIVLVLLQYEYHDDMLGNVTGIAIWVPLVVAHRSTHVTWFGWNGHRPGGMVRIG